MEKLVMMACGDETCAHVGSVGSVTHIDDGCALQTNVVSMAVEEVTALDRLIRSEQGEAQQPLSLDGLMEEVKGQMRAAVNALVDAAA